MTLDHRYAIDAALAAITTDLPALERVEVTGGNVTGGASTTQLPGGTTRMSLLADTLALLTSLCLLVLDERRLDGTTVGDGADERARFLVLHAGWLAGHDTAADTAAELDDLARRIHALVAPSGVRRIPVGACPLDCAGVVFAALDGDRDPDLVCDVRPRDHVWGRSHYELLARMLGTDAPERMTPTQLAAWLTVRFRRRVTEGMVTGWIRRASPREREALAADQDGSVMRVPLTELYLARRSERANVA